MYGIKNFTIDNYLVEQKKLKNSIKATFTMSGSGNLYRYVDLTNVTDYTIVDGDVLEYYLWWETANEAIAIDLIGSGFTLRDNGARDYLGHSPHPNTTTFNSLAYKNWYKRYIPLDSTLVGKTISNYCIVCENNTNGTFTAYLSDIKITRRGSLVKTIWSSGGVTQSVLLNSGSNSHTLTTDQRF